MHAMTLLVVEILATHPGRGIVAHRQPRLGHRGKGQVAGRPWATHLRGYPAWLESIGQYLRPSASHGEGQHDVQYFTGRIGLGAVPTAGRPLRIIQTSIAAHMHS